MGQKIGLGIFIIFLLTMILVSGCAYDDFKKVKDEALVGKTISVHGIVSNPYRMGDLSGYTLTDKLGEQLQIKAETLPKNSAEITVSGVLMKDSIFGYYLKAK